MSVEENSTANSDVQDENTTMVSEHEHDQPTFDRTHTTTAEPTKKSGSFMRWLMILIVLALLATVGWWWLQKQGGLPAFGSNNGANVASVETVDTDASTGASASTDTTQTTNSASSRPTQAAMASTLASDVRDLQTEFNRTLEDANDKLSSATQRIDHNDRRQKMLSDEVITLRERLAHLESSVARLAEQSVQAETSIKLDQLESTLMMGEERYRMYADRPAAKRALKLADELIGTLDGVRFNSLRQTLAGERAALDAAPEDPRANMGSVLMEVREQMAYLPTLQGDEVVLADEADPQFVQKLAGLVTIRRQTDGVSSVSESQKDASLAVIQMNVSRAQLALSLDDEGGFKDALNEVQNAIEHTFVQDDEKTQAVLSKLSDLLAQKMRTDIPALGSTLAELRRIRALNAIRATPKQTPPPAPAAPTDTPSTATPSPVTEGSTQTEGESA